MSGYGPTASVGSGVIAGRSTKRQRMSCLRQSQTAAQSAKTPGCLYLSARKQAGLGRKSFLYLALKAFLQVIFPLRNCAQTDRSAGRGKTGIGCKVLCPCELRHARIESTLTAASSNAPKRQRMPHIFVG